MKILAGTSGFAFKEWKGPFYPEKLPDKEMLPFYSTRFPTVEINNSFYQMPKESVLLDWAAKVPEQFTFAIKANQRITHHTRLKPESYPHLEYFLKTVSVLGNRLGPILFQLPPNMKKDTERLRAFLGQLPAGRKYAVEFRHDSWFGDEVFDAMREHDVAFVVIEQEDFSSPVLATASWSYLRLHKLDYDAAALTAWAGRVSSLGVGEAVVYFKHDEGIGSGPKAVDTFVGLTSEEPQS
jgi:uncharacterized protein YecE (DUF72 family)